MNAFLSELRFAFRRLRSQPGISIIGAVALAMGIGFTTITFSIVHGALCQGLPFPDGDRIYHLAATDPSQGIERTGVPIHDFVDWGARQRRFAEIIKQTMEPQPPLGSAARIQLFEWEQGYASSGAGDVNWTTPTATLSTATWVPGPPPTPGRPSPPTACPSV